MAGFSERMGFLPEPRREVIEDAPVVLRQALIDRVIGKVTFVDRDSRYHSHRPVGIKYLLEEISYLRLQSPPESYEDSWHCGDILRQELFAIEWFHFYDAIELISKAVLSFEIQPGDDVLCDFDVYQAEVNSIFDRLHVGWQLDAKGELNRTQDAETIKLEAAAYAAVAAFDPVKEHLAKAKRYTQMRPADPANSIKESISAVESQGKFLYPATATLGDVVSKMKNQGVIPVGLITMIEKYYAFTNQEPAVRHGGTSVERVQLAEADFCYSIALSTIKYLAERVG